MEDARFTLLFCPVLFLLPVPFRSSSAAGMEEFGISPGQLVAVFWDKSSPEEALKKLVARLQELTGSEGQVFMENVTQLLQCEFLLVLGSQGEKGLDGSCLCVVPDTGSCFVWGHPISFQMK